MHWVLLAFLGVAAASQITELNPAKEYTFHYTSSILSGIPELGRQHAGLKLTTIVKAQKFPDNTIRIKFQDSKFKNYNDEVEKDMRFPRAPVREEDKQEVPASIKQHLEMPFKVVTHENLVEKIQVEATEPEFITNIKKAAVSQLLAVSQSRLTEESEGRRQLVTSMHKMEESIMGECDTHYTVERMPEYLAREFEEREQIPMRELCQGKDYYEVIKTKDLKNCRERPVYVHVYGARAVSDGSLGSSVPFASESSVSRNIICGTPDSFILRVASNQHKAVISPSGKFEHKEWMEVTSTSIVSLRSVEDKKEEIPDVKAPKPRGSLMFEHPKQDDYFSATVSEKSLVPQARTDNRLEQDWYRAQMVQPDIESRPKTLYPTIKSPEETMRQLVVTFKRIVEIARQSPESSESAEDVAGSAVMVSRALVRLGLQDIKALWQQIEASLPENLKVPAYNSFLDLVSISGTNPAIKFIIEEVKSGKLVGENAAMIVSNAIRSAKTPTKQLLKELIDLLKHVAQQDNRNMVSTVALAVTRLIHRACVHETSSVTDFPAKSFGRFCDEKTPEINRDLIPFLAEKLFAARKSDINQLLTYINALGNLGHEGAALHLLKVIDDGSFDSHLRSVAVYQLRKTASTNPALYRPIILQLIANEAESDEVRMAAITILPRTRPASFHLNKLAIRTWWEPSKQVSAYITSTLHALANPELARHSKIYKAVIEPAREAIRIAKPTDAGILTSHNIMISQFLDTLKAAVNMKVQYVFSEEDELPRTLFMKTSVKSKTHVFNKMEVAAHMEGGQFLINKLYETYARFLSEEEKARIDTQSDIIKNIINVESRRMRKPEAHVTIKSLGLQRIFSIDSRMVEELLEKIAVESVEALSVEKTHSVQFMKIIDMNGHNAVIPTESGLPVYVSHRTPLVVSGEAVADIQVKDIKDMKAGVTIKPVVNYKQIAQAGIFCPITKKLLFAGVDSSIHVTLPLVAEVAFKEGQLELIIKSPQDQESQREKPVFEMRVKPYTTNYDMTSPNMVPITKSADTKVIRSANPLKVKEVPLGEALGLDLRLKVETEQAFADVAELLHQMSQHSPLTLLTLPFPLKTVKDHSMRLMYNPRNSNTKDISLVLSAGHARKQSSSDVILTPASPIPDIKKHIEMAMQKVTGAGRAVALNIQARLHGNNRAVEKEMIAQVTVAKNDENSLMKMIMFAKLPNAQQPYIMDIDATRMVRRPINRWDKEAMLAEDLRSVINIKAKAGLEGQQMHDLMVDLVVERSEQMKAHVKNSEAWRKCEADSARELRLSESCIKARSMAASLDVIKAELSLPRLVTRHPYMVTLWTAVKAYFLPYLSIEASSYNRQSPIQDNYQIVAKVAPNSKSITVDFSAEGSKIVLNNVRLIHPIKDMLPISIKDSLAIGVVKMLSKNKLPARCSIEGSRVSTFDKLIYDYTLNDCEHVIFRDCTESPKVMVTVKKTSSQHIVKAIIDGNMYELEMVRSTRGARTNPGQLKVNGQVKQALPKVQGQPIRFEDASNQIYLYEDGVYEIFSLRHGLTLRADSQSAEVKAFQGRLRNMACGLCGDLNDEKTADVVSAHQCVMSSPRLAAYSYMVVDNQCAGIPAQDKPVYQEEAKQCVRKAVVPSKVLSMFQERQHSVKRSQAPMRHLDMERGQKICISMKQVHMCPDTRSPSEIVPMQMPFFCVARDQEGYTLQELAQSGEKINEATRFPISFSSMVYVPSRC